MPHTGNVVFPQEFAAWLSAQPGETPLGLAGGYRSHPIGAWLQARGPDSRVIVKVVRQAPGVWVYGGPSPLPLYLPPSHWITRFCHGLMPPDAYRTVTAAECLTTLARIVLIP